MYLQLILLKSLKEKEYYYSVTLHIHTLVKKNIYILNLLNISDFIRQKALFIIKTHTGSPKSNRCLLLITLSRIKRKIFYLTFTIAFYQFYINIFMKLKGNKTSLILILSNNFNFLLLSVFHIWERSVTLDYFDSFFLSTGEEREQSNRSCQTPEALSLIFRQCR